MIYVDEFIDPNEGEWKSFSRCWNSRWRRLTTWRAHVNVPGMAHISPSTWWLINSLTTATQLRLNFFHPSPINFPRCFSHALYWRSLATLPCAITPRHNNIFTKRWRRSVSKLVWNFGSCLSHLFASSKVHGWKFIAKITHFSAERGVEPKIKTNYYIANEGKDKKWKQHKKKARDRTVCENPRLKTMSGILPKKKDFFPCASKNSEKSKTSWAAATRTREEKHERKSCCVFIIIIERKTRLGRLFALRQHDQRGFSWFFDSTHGRFSVLLHICTTRRAARRAETRRRWKFHTRALINRRNYPRQTIHEMIRLMFMSLSFLSGEFDL